MIQGTNTNIGWHAARLLGDEELAGATVRVEHVGPDWVVFRDRSGLAHARAFSSKSARDLFFKRIND